MASQISGAMTELQFINYIFSQNSLALATDNGITSEFFTTYKDHYTFITDFVNQYNQLPSKETFQGQFSGNFDWLAVSDPPEYLVERLKEEYLFRKVVNKYSKIGELLKDGHTEKAVEIMSEITQKYYQQSGGHCVELIGDAKERYDSYIERVKDPAKSFISTGLKELDEVIGGWDMLNETAMIAARTGIGKSWVLIYFALQAAKAGLRVGYYSGEMESDFVGYRLDTFASNLPNGSLTHGNGNIKDQYKNYIDDLSNNIPGKIFCITPDDKMFNGSVTVAKLKAFIEKYNLQMLCIDQFSLLEDQRRAKLPREQAINISKDLRTLQRMKKIPFLCAVQLNREDTSDGGPSSRNIAESDRIGQDSTTILFIENKGDNVCISIGKSRNAKTGDKLTYVWNKNMGTMHYIPTEKDAKKGVDSAEVAQSYAPVKSDTIF